jgi:glycosyltransferase involved in cell wall biosynthesis
VKDIADEIVVLDSGSTDRTVGIAKSLGAKVFFHEWDGYPQQRNRGIGLCSEDWVFVLDADEEVSEELRNSISKAISSRTAEVYMVCRKTYYLGKFLEHTWYPEWRVRLFKKGLVRFEGDLHEQAIFKGEAHKLKGDLYHYSYESLYHQYEKTLKYAEIMAESHHKKKKNLGFITLCLIHCGAFLRFIFFKRAFW